MLITIYIFGASAFYFLRDDFAQIEGLSWGKEIFSTSLMYSFLTNVNYGLRIDGAVGELTVKKIWDHNKIDYMGVWLYANFYLIVEIFILIGVVLGIIIDSYSELRENSEKADEDREKNCYICGMNKDDLEKNNINFNLHTKIEHNLWIYLEYIIGLNYVDPQETNAINSYVIGQIQAKSISWFPEMPQKLKDLQESDENDDEDENLNTKLSVTKQTVGNIVNKAKHNLGRITEENAEYEGSPELKRKLILFFSYLYFY